MMATNTADTTGQRFATTGMDFVGWIVANQRRRAAERRCRGMIKATDRLLDQLEASNLGGGGRLDARMRRSIDRTLEGLPPAARERFPNCRTVQEALDGTFAVQEELLSSLQRMIRRRHGGSLFPSDSYA
jgi:hypothetical protein